jgi:regulator of sirC expression with transglutaminase-like and TPR domain
MNSMVLLAEKKLLKDSEITAFVSLLDGAEDKTLNLMSEQIVNFEDSTLKNIENKVVQINNPVICNNWHSINRQHILKQLQQWKQKPELEKGLFILARLKNPGLLEERYTAILDDLAHRAAYRLNSNSTKDDVVRAINEVIYKEEVFVGNQLDYYDLDNNFIHTVIEKKTGNPIMMSSLYILVGRRLGLDIQGLGTPGHFIVQLNGTLLDPFFGGREVTKDECILRAQELSVVWHDEYLDPIDDRAIIARCIRNIISVYKKHNDYDKASELTALLKNI